MADGASPATGSPIPRTDRAAGPTSFGQQRLWFGHELEPDAPHHALGRAYAIRGALDADALARAFDEVVRRHEPLRTTFHLERGVVCQRVEPPTPFRLARADWSGKPLDRGWQDVGAQLAGELHEPFDPARGPVLRGRLTKLAGDWWALVLIQRFIGADRWSRALLHRELSQLYDAFTHGRPSPLEPLPLRYVDFAAWQRERLSGARLERLLAYWTGHLRDAPRSPRLPVDRARAASRSRPGETVNRRIPAAVTERIGALSVRQRVTPFMVYLAAFDVLLHRCTGESDVVVGVPVAGRLRPETEPLVGFFGNTLVLRADLSGDPAFIEVLQRVRRASLDAFAHQELPFERLIEALPVDREPFSDPLARVLFAYQNLPDSPIELSGCEVHEREGVSEAFPFELALSVYPSDAGVRLRAQYQADLFLKASVERLLRRFELLLNGIASDAATPISRLAIMDGQERGEILARTAGVSPVAPAAALVHGVFEAQAARTPGVVALRCLAGGVAVSYGELDSRATAMARHLRRLGVTRDTVVALAMARSPELIAAMLGVLKAGGAYLPLEPGPEARTRAIVEGCGARLVLSDGSFDVPHVPGFAVVDVRAFSAEGARQEDGAERDSALAQGEDDLAYVMYTSGSTGAPKGVEIPHRAVVRLALADIVPMQAGDVVLQLAPPSFDASTFEIWTPLAAGATLAFYPGPVFDLDLFDATIRAEGVTHLWLTASLFNTVVDLRPDALAGIRYLLVGGEALSVPHVRAALDRHPALRLFNGYGPTEVTTFSLVHEVTRPVPVDVPSIPLGRPIAHTVAVVLDACGQVAPVGVPGELFLGGRGLARGYRNAPDLTAERFVDLALQPGSTQRLYRTGDRVRALHDGAIEFLGRLDRQVKLRGFRIELEEIEAHLAAHEAVAACAVTLHEDPAGARGLAGLVAPRPGARITPDLLRDHLAGRVPAYMVPGTIRIVGTLPATPSGKIDRQALGLLVAEAATAAPPPSSAATGLQEAVAEIWRDVLNRRSIGPHDDFFDLGGHSLLAVQVVARLRATFDVALPLSAIFEHPTIAGIAAVVSSQRPAARVDPAEALAALDRQDADSGRESGGGVPVSFGQLRLWFLHQLDPDGASYNSTRSYRLRGALDAGALRRACDALLDRHAALRTRFVFDGREPLQVVEPGARAPFEIVDLRALPADGREDEAASRRAAHAARPFDLAAAPLLRVLLLRLGEDDHVLTITAHHIAIDGWSMGVIGRELGALYDACAADRPAALEPLPVQYADYALWQRRRFQGSRREALLDYWRTALRGVPYLRLPSPPGGSARGSAATAAADPNAAQRHGFTIDADLVHDLRDLGRETNATLFMVLLAAFQAVLANLAGQHDVAVAVPMANRARREFEGIVGFFVNTLVLRTSLEGRPTARELISRVRIAALGAYDHQECPFEQVVDDLRSPREHGRMPLTPVLFALQTAPDAGLSMGDLEVTRLGRGDQRARFDLELTLRPAPAGALDAAVVYRTFVLSPEAAADLARELERTLRTFVARPDARITSDVPHALSDGVEDRSVERLERLSVPRSVVRSPAARRSVGRPPSEAASAGLASAGGLTITEATLARLWRELLHRDAVGPDDDFFDLGGHSLLAVQLFARLQSECGWGLPVATLFQHGTIRQLARVLDDRREDLWAPVVPLRGGSGAPPVFLVHGIGGEVIGFRLLARHLRGDRPVYAIQAPGPGAPPDLPFEVEALCARYVEAVQAVEPAGPYVLGGYSAGGVFAIEMARQLSAAGMMVPLVLVLDGGLPPGARTASRRAGHTPGTLLRQATDWVHDETVRLRPGGWPRWLRGKLRAQVWRATRRFQPGGHRRLDLRDRFGTHGLPAEYQAWVERRFDAFCRYRMRPYEGAVLLVRSRSGSLFGPPGAALAEDWRHFASGPFTVTSVACSHRGLLEEPHVAELAAHVQEALEAAGG